MGFLYAFCGVYFEQFHVGFNLEHPFLVGLWAEYWDCSGYIGGYTSKQKYLVVHGQCSLESRGGKGSPLACVVALV